MSALKNRAFQQRLPFHNGANDCVSSSEPYVSLEYSFPVSPLWTQPLGTCSQPGREAHVSVCLSALEAQSSRRIPSMIPGTFAKRRTRRLCPKNNAPCLTTLLACKPATPGAASVAGWLEETDLPEAQHGCAVPMPRRSHAKQLTQGRNPPASASSNSG